MLIASVGLPLDALALEHTFEAVPDLEVQAERIAAHSTEWVMPCLWTSDAPVEDLENALEDDPSVDEIVDSYAYGDEKYYQIKWHDDVTERINAMLDMEASVLDASSDARGWRMQIRFATRDHFETFREYLAEHDVSFELLELTQPGSPRQAHGNLTPDQRDALVVAVERGYFEVPRQTTLREVADELDITHQTLSEHLRRGTAKLVATTLTTDVDGIEADVPNPDGV